MNVSRRTRILLSTAAALALLLPAGPLAQARTPDPAPRTSASADTARWAPALAGQSSARNGVEGRRSARLVAAHEDARTPAQARTVEVGGSRVRVPTAGGMAIDDTTRTLYVADLDGHRVLVVDLRGCTASRQRCRPAVGVIAMGAHSEELQVDARTHTLYASLQDDAAVAVVDIRRCRATDASSCSGPVARVPVGGAPIGFGLDERTRTLYVGNVEDRVTLVDTTACNGSRVDGCAAPLATVTSGPAPIWPSVDAARSTVYVGNADGSSLSVIDTRSCRRGDVSGCGRAPVEAPVGNGAFTATTDPATDTLYVSNQGDGTLTVLDAATCNALDTSGCASPGAPTVKVSYGVQTMAVVGRTLYVLSDADTIAAVDLRHCQAHDATGCGQVPRTLQADAGPWELRLDAGTGSLYVSAIADGTVQVLDPQTCGTRRTDGCRREAPTAPGGSYGSAVGVVEHTLYQSDPGRGTLLLLNTATCRVDDRSGCTPPAPPVPLGTSPGPIEIDPGTHTLYVGDFDALVLYVFDTRTCNVSRPTGCAPLASVPVGTLNGLGVNPRTHTVYVVARDAKTLRVLDGSHCNATDLSGCGAAQQSIDLGVRASFPYVEPTTNTVYLPSTDDAGIGTLTLVDGAACDRGTSGCRVVASTVVGTGPVGVDADPATHTLYTAINNDESQPASLSLLDLRACSARNVRGCATTWPTAPTVHASFGLTVDEATHRVFNTGFKGALAVVDGGRCNTDDQSGCPSRPNLIAVGNHAAATTIDPVRHTAYVLNSFDATVSLVDTRRPCRDELCFRR